MNRGSDHSSTTNTDRSANSTDSGSLTDAVAGAVDTMVRLPIRATEATMDLMLQGMKTMTGSSSGGDSSHTSDSSSSNSSGSSWTSVVSGASNLVRDEDLSGDDLKYVIWSIVFTKPGFECILQPQQEELVNYSADANSYAATKMAQLLESARHGHREKPNGWADRYPVESTQQKAHSEAEASITLPADTSISGEHGKGTGWRIPPEDQKYMTFLYRVDRRLPRQTEVTRVEHVTVERATRVG
jgi:hypothetical protein